MARPEKIAVVESLSAVFQEARSIVLNDFTGLNVEKLSALRKLCRESKVDYRVVKNTLAKRGAQGTPVEELTRFFDGPTAIATSMESENIPAKILAEFAGENEAPRFKAALVEGRILEEDAIIELAKLPSRDVLLSMALAGIKAPANGLVGALQGTLRKLLYAMNAIVEKGNTGQSS
jgi:large subunit ribosomal protein L10